MTNTNGQATKQEVGHAKHNETQSGCKAIDKPTNK